MSTPCQLRLFKQPSAKPEALTALMPLRCQADGPRCHEVVYVSAVLAASTSAFLNCLTKGAGEWGVRDVCLTVWGAKDLGAENTRIKSKIG